MQELYNGECVIPLNRRNTKNPKLLPQGNPVCEAGLAMWKDGKFSDSGRTSQKFCCPLKSSKNADCPCHHKNFYNGKKHRGCTKYITIPDDLRLSDSPSIETANISKAITLFVQNVKDIILVSKIQGRNVCG